MGHLSKHTIDGYRQRSLVPAELLAVDDHLATCEVCYERVISLQPNLPRSIGALSSDLTGSEPYVDDHLTYESIAALVDDDADEIGREIATSHLEVCGFCSQELEALREMKWSVKPQPAPVTAVNPARERTGVFWSWFTWPRLATAVLLVLAATALMWLIWRSSQKPNEQMTVASNSNPGGPEPSSSTSAAQPNPSVVRPRVLVALDDAGGKVTLDEAGKIEGLDNLSPALTESVKAALKDERLNLSTALRDLKRKSGTLMGSDQEGVPFRLVEPVGIVIRANQPTFRWKPLSGASSYVVQVYDTDFNQVAKSLSQPATSWRVPAPLQRGGVYIWQVTANKNGEEIKSPTAAAGEARFNVLSGAKLSEIDRVQRTHSNSHLTLGVLYAEAGLLQDAQREFRLLLRSNPESPVAQKLLQEVSK